MNTLLFNHLAFLIGCLGTIMATSSPAAETNAVPGSFKASIGGFFGTTYSVELRQGTLFYWAANAPQKAVPTKVTPTAQQWREFRRSLDEINIWQWPTNYPSPGVRDGVRWSLDIQYHDRVLKTRGSNNFPSRAGKPSGSPKGTKAFEAYTAAVKRLLGGKRQGVSMRASNHSVERTGASRSARLQFVCQWRLAPAAHADRPPLYEQAEA